MARWEREDGCRVLSCETAKRLMQQYGEVAFLTQDARTRVLANDCEQKLRERETITFARSHGSWQACTTASPHP